jgi:hypothetical protein
MFFHGEEDNVFWLNSILYLLQYSILGCSISMVILLHLLTICTLVSTVVCMS